MTRRAIDELGAAAARDRIARAIGVARENVGFSWTGERVDRIVLVRKGKTPRDLIPSEIQAIAAAGVLRGADGWEIEEEPAIGRPHLCLSGCCLECFDCATKPGAPVLCADCLTRRKRCNDRNRPDRTPSPDAVALSPECDAIDDARMAGDLDRLASLAERYLRERNEVATREPDVDEDARQRALRNALRRYGESLGRSAFQGVAGLLRAAARDWQEGDGVRAALLSLARSVDVGPDARAEGAAPRTTDGALTAYLLEHYPDEWRPGEDALALAIRLLGETQRIVDEAHLEAERSDEAAKEMAAELAKVRAELNVASSDRDRYWDGWSKTRAELNAANSRTAEAEHDRDVAREAARKAREERDEARRECGRIGNAAAKAVRERDEARADLAKIRGAVRGIAAQLGVPHG